MTQAHSLTAVAALFLTFALGGGFFFGALFDFSLTAIFAGALAGCHQAYRIVREQ